jgi:hypothetical protein
MALPHDSLPPEVIDALRRGSAIEAMKALRAKGVTLRDATALIHAHIRGFQSVHAAERADRALPPDAAMALARGDKIEAIKLVRAETGLGLKEAHDWVEAHRSTPRMPTGLAPGEVPRIGGAWLWILVILAVVVAVWLTVG